MELEREKKSVRKQKKIVNFGKYWMNITRRVFCYIFFLVVALVCIICAKSFMQPITQHRYYAIFCDLFSHHTLLHRVFGRDGLFYPFLHCKIKSHFFRVTSSDTYYMISEQNKKSVG